MAAGTDTQIDAGHTFGATITAGQCVYLDVNGQWQLTDVDSATTAKHVVDGYTLSGGSAGQIAVVALSGDVAPGFAVTVGKLYVATITPGGIALVADLTTNWYTSLVGFGRTTTYLRLTRINTGVVNA